MTTDIAALLAEVETPRQWNAAELADFATRAVAALEKARDTIESLTAPATDDPGAHGGPIPRYAMLDVWMALFGTSHPEFDDFYAEHGYAETWARLCAEIRTRPAPATDDDQQAFAAELSKHWANMNGQCACGWAHPQYGARFLDAEHFIEHLAHVLALAGFRRSSRVPVSQDELAETLFDLRYPDGCWSHGTTEPREVGDDEIATSLLATHDIYPKADRKPADSETGDDRG